MELVSLTSPSLGSLPTELPGKPSESFAWSQFWVNYVSETNVVIRESKTSQGRAASQTGDILKTQWDHMVQTQNLCIFKIEV